MNLTRQENLEVQYLKEDPNSQQNRKLAQFKMETASYIYRKDFTDDEKKKVLALLFECRRRLKSYETAEEISFKMQDPKDQIKAFLKF